MIKKITGVIQSINTLSETAKEVRIKLSEPLDFNPGSFINIFFDIQGEKVRRAYSISSPSSNQNEITITMRLNPLGKVSPLFWEIEMLDKTIELMGPLGLNTADKMHHEKIYLFAFGVGSGVVKSLAEYFSRIKKVTELIIMTGSRTEDEILYRNYFEKLVQNSKKISVSHVVTQKIKGSALSEGYIQKFIDDFDFNNSDVFVCGQEVACKALVEKVNSMHPTDCDFFIEAFH